MKKIILLGTLAAVFAASHASAAVLPLQAATITASYIGPNSGQGSGVLGLDHGFADEAGSNVSALDPSASGVEFLTSDYLFAFDFAEDGTLTVFNNALIPSGAYSMRFDFGATLPGPIAAFTLLDASLVGGMPQLSVIDGHTIGLDLSALSWGGEFLSFTRQIALAQPADVPEPGGAALLGVAALGMALTRRRRA
jgi:hypothetical protein